MGGRWNLQHALIDSEDGEMLNVGIPLDGVGDDMMDIVCELPPLRTHSLHAPITRKWG